MEYVYAALVLHEADQEINEDKLTAVLDAAGVDVEASRVKALVAALEDVDIAEAIQQPAVTASAPAQPEAAPAGDEGEQAPEEAQEEEEEEEEEEEGPSGEGLGELFG